MPELEDIVNLDRYPLQGVSDEDARAFAADCRRQYMEYGVLLLADFLSRHGLQAMAAYTQKIFYGRAA